MTVKVFIERTFKEAPVPENFRAINTIRRSALMQKGYVSGETLVDFESNRVVVVSTWTSPEDWKTWLGSKTRAELEKELTPHLKDPMKATVFVTSADYSKEGFA
jgi:heme-degrading monooxygenase HmoA